MLILCCTTWYRKLSEKTVQAVQMPAKSSILSTILRTCSASVQPGSPSHAALGTQLLLGHQQAPATASPPRTRCQRGPEALGGRAMERTTGTSGPKGCRGGGRGNVSPGSAPPESGEPPGPAATPGLGVTSPAARPGALQAGAGRCQRPQALPAVPGGRAAALQRSRPARGQAATAEAAGHQPGRGRRRAGCGRDAAPSPGDAAKGRPASAGGRSCPREVCWGW